MFQALRWKFKSHYVVWKQTLRNLQFSCEFCLNRTMQYGNRRHDEILGSNVPMFKSHYVVWKQVLEAGKAAHDVGLNRTMQYGNPFCTFCTSFFYTCLNRTMQYGNVPALHLFYFSFLRLNRTMQYGNAANSPTTVNRQFV